MTNIFLSVFEISVSVSILIAVLLLLTPLLNKRYAAKWKYWIWIILALRLVVPFSGTDVRSMANTLLQANSQTTLDLDKSNMDDLPEQAPPQGRVVVEIPAQMTTPIAQPSEKSSINVTPLDVAAFVWAVGSLVFISLNLISYARYRRQVLRRGEVITDSRILCQMFRLKHELGIKDTLQVIEYPEAASPMMIGFIEPVLILPEEPANSEELYFILKHELVHLKRKDVYMKLLLTAANAVHWFNPLVWIMQKEASVDMELSCDERVTQGTDYAARKAYTETLLSTLHKRCARRTVLSTQFYGGKQIMKKRFKNILIKTGKKNGAAILMCAILLTASLGTLVGCSVAASGQGESGNAEAASGQTGNADAAPGLLVNAGIEGNLSVYVSEQPESGNEQSAQGTNSNAGSTTVYHPVEIPETLEKLVYIEGFDGEKLTFDEVEWIQVPGERATQLGITEDDAPSGFEVYNEETVKEMLPLAKDCVCTLFDWTSNYVKMEVTPERFMDILEDRAAPNIPYHVIIKNNEIVEIFEQYVP